VVSQSSGRAEALTSIWHRDYSRAVEAAKEQGRYLFIFFHEHRPNPARQAFENRTLTHPQIVRQLQAYECATLPLDATIVIDGKPGRLLDHPSFRELQHRQGIAILDFAHPGTPYYGQVVNVFPFSSGHYYSARSLMTILDLPSGTITQRTMVYAVRMHPERPASTRGKFHPILAEEAQSHSQHQAQIGVQGHHGWGYRFQRILGRMRFGAAPVEIVAESWPGKGLVDAAIDCVDSWRHSPGHWQQVRSVHGAYGYDIKQGANGIWYATGIFAGYRR
jgi:hypothetical protein